MRKRGKKQPMRAYQSGDWLTVNEAATLLAQRDQRPNDTPREGIDRWRKRIEYAVSAKKLVTVANRLRLDELAAWARTLKVSGSDWLAKLTDLPRLTLRDCVEENASTSDEAQDIRLPGSLEECHEALRRLHRENSALKQENELLREPAAKYVAFCKKHRENALKRWHPN